MNDNIEINEMCRLCLTKEEVNVDIFEGKGDEEQLDFKISTCLPVQISRNDCFPNKICNDCSDKVNSMFLFWNTSVSSEKILLKWFLQCGANNQNTGNSDTRIAELTSSDVKINVKDEEVADFLPNESPEEVTLSNFVADYGEIKQEIIEFLPDEKLSSVVNTLDGNESEIMDTALCRTDSADNPLAQQNEFSHQKMKIARRYVRKSTRQSWDDIAMQEAIKAVQEKKMGWLKAAKLYQVPQSTLRRRACNKNKHVKGVQKGLGRFSNTFDHQTEKELVEHIKFLESRLFELTPTEVRRLVFEFAEKNKIKHRFNREKKIAGKEWLRGFRERNRDISLRQPEATSVAKARAFNKPQVSKFFEVLYSILEAQSISVEKIYNMDESDLSAQKPPKVLGLTGEGREHVTIICCMSATGEYIPPALIFARKDRKDELFDKAPPGSLGLCQESGWMNSELFVKWLKHFYRHANPSRESKALLLLDGHVSHTSLEAVSFCKENNIILICLPAHCSHRMQPLDVSFFGPLKVYYDETCTAWLKNHSGHVITAYQVGELFSEAYKKAATIHNALSGFAKTGISPFNPNVFPDCLYEPSDPTDVTLERNNYLEVGDPLEEDQLDENNLSEEGTRTEVIFKQETNEIYSEEVSEV